MACTAPILTRRRALIGAGALCLANREGAWAAAAESTRLLSYHDFAPFITAPGQGLSHDLHAALLRRAELPPDALTLEMLPRRRLEAQMAQAQWQGVVPWVAPGWLAASEQMRAVWSVPLMDDAELVLSRRDKPLHYENFESLQGHTLGGVLGYKYGEFDQMAKRGQLRRMDSFTMEANLRMLLMGRVDVIFMPRSGLGWWRQHIADFDAQVHVAEKLRAQYQRRLMLSPQVPAELQRRLLEAARQLPADAAWKERLRHYGIQPVPAAPLQSAGVFP